ncbi:MAG: hypothetical protein PF637_06485 [Spirochaetes bacterium]|jgi:hypothetical protein|nr:hypothetical protein [Spirochaetota bacterium]
MKYLLVLITILLSSTLLFSQQVPKKIKEITIKPQYYAVALPKDTSKTTAVNFDILIKQNVSEKKFLAEINKLQLLISTETDLWIINQNRNSKSLAIINKTNACLSIPQFILNFERVLNNRSNSEKNIIANNDLLQKFSKLFHETANLIYYYHDQNTEKQHTPKEIQFRENVENKFKSMLRKNFWLKSLQKTKANFHKTSKEEVVHFFKKNIKKENQEAMAFWFSYSKLNWRETNYGHTNAPNIDDTMKLEKGDCQDFAMINSYLLTKLGHNIKLLGVLTKNDKEITGKHLMVLSDNYLIDMHYTTKLRSNSIYNKLKQHLKHMNKITSPVFVDIESFHNKGNFIEEYLYFEEE